ncbi:hypothetical protein [Proteus mirabilis]|uniref:hypothetical protein n=1 Tax=Proteus mirabilis TaxID=584 RepID=UPI000B497EAE|nr:hypothetical protein [Proteus mirabilis]ASB03741.1 hypothetical protein AM403_19485 [Proteus mirabilis]
MDDLIKKILSKETLLLALLTGSSYFFAYLFEFGYSQYFNYPHEFISINLENIIYAFIAFLVITFFTALFFIVSSFITIKFGDIGLIVNQSLMITYFPIFFTVLAAFHEDENLKFFILIDLIIFVVMASIPLYFRAKMKKEIEKAIEFKKLNPTSEQIREIMRIVTSDLFSIRNLLSEIKGFNIQFKIIFSIITFACISYIFISIGNIYAQNQRYLSIIEDKDKNYAIVRQYNETIIAKEIKNNLIFNEENHTFKVNDLKDKKIKKFIQN